MVHRTTRFPFIMQADFHGIESLEPLTNHGRLLDLQCPALFPFRSPPHNRKLCYNIIAYGAGPCGSWAQTNHDVAYGAGPCGSWAQTNHPAAVPPQWLPVFLATNTPGPPTNHRRLDDDNDDDDEGVTPITNLGDLRAAVVEYNADVTDAESEYGPINNWDVSGITDLSYLFQDLGNFNADISSWNTSKVTIMAGMFRVRTLAPTSSREPVPAKAACAVAPAPRPLTSRGPHLPPRRMPTPCDSAVRGCLQSAADPRHVQGYNHAVHVRCAYLRPDLQPRALPSCRLRVAPAHRPLTSRPAPPPASYAHTLRLGSPRAPSISR